MEWFLIVSIALVFIFVLQNKSWNPRNPGLYPIGKLLIMGHRGAPDYAGENSIASFKKALDLGASGVELDVQYSRDKELVVYHDWEIIKPSGKIVLLANLSLKELREYRPNKISESAHFPLLDEILKILPAKKVLNIEIKCKNVRSIGIETDVIKSIKKFKFEQNCIISSFNPFVLRRIKKIDPTLLTAFLWSEKDPLFLINSPYLAWIAKPDGFHPDIRHLNEKLVIWAKKRNLKIMAFTVNTREELQRAKDLKIDGIFTDNPLIGKS